MHGENLLINDSRNRQAVEAVGESLPKLDVVPPLAFIIETVYTVDGCAFVVAAQDKEVFGILYLVGQEEADGLERLFASVDVVAKEEVVRFGGESAIFEKSQEVVVLTMDIAADLCKDNRY